MARNFGWLLALLMIGISCSLFPGAATDTPVAPPSATITPTVTLTPTLVPSGPCEATATSDVTVYTRPSLAADVFGTLPGGSIQPMEARTGEGWFGFDPGVAQAANIGPFRLRWVHQDDVSLTGDCASLPVVWAPPAGVCFDMPMEDVNVYAEPDLTSAVLVVLHVEEFAAVLGINGSGWAKVDLGPGNTSSSVVGWVEEFTLNMNGPCDSLPLVSAVTEIDTST